MKRFLCIVVKIFFVIFLISNATSTLYGDEVSKTLNVFGSVKLLDGEALKDIKITLKVDIDKNQEYSFWEMISVTTDENGTYEINYVPEPDSESLANSKLKTDLGDIDFGDSPLGGLIGLFTEYAEIGFDAFIKNAPLELIITFEKRGYSKITKVINLQKFDIDLDVLLKPLQPLGCNDDSCFSLDGRVELKGLEHIENVSEAFAETFSPDKNLASFPGTFFDNSGNFLKSTGFTEIQLIDNDGNQINELATPIAVRFLIDKDKWNSLIDLESGSDKIEIPIFSFDDGSATWKREENGHLESEDGIYIAESELSFIQDGSYSGDVYGVISVTHLSMWNIDQPIDTHTCVKGKLVDQDGNLIVGAKVNAMGVSYNGMSITNVIGDDGYFALPVMRSENTDEDIDSNGIFGEIQMIEIYAQKSDEILVGNSTVTTPTTNNKIVGDGKSISCLPASCECTDLGDFSFKIVDTNICKIKVRTVFDKVDPESFTISEIPYVKGSGIAGLNVSGEQLNGLQGVLLSLDYIPTGTDGYATINIPYTGDDPIFFIHNYNFTESASGNMAMLYGFMAISGCDENTTYELEETYWELSLSGLFLQSAVDAANDEEITTTAGCNCDEEENSSKSNKKIPIGMEGLILPLGFIVIIRRINSAKS